MTKSGGNALHGTGFEFLRNTDLDAKNYFSTQRSIFQQNQYGGTLGGPIKQNKLFFFADYQGQHTKQGQDTGVVAVPSLANRTGNFSDSSTFTGNVNGPYLAQTLRTFWATRLHRANHFLASSPETLFHNRHSPLPRRRYSSTSPLPIWARTISSRPPKRSRSTMKRRPGALTGTQTDRGISLSTTSTTNTISTIPILPASVVQRFPIQPVDPSTGRRMVWTNCLW